MFRRTLPKDAVLWWQGDAAETLAIVEHGRVGIRAEGRLLDVVLPGAALGEAAVLNFGGPPARRTADVFVLDEDTVVAEYPVAALPETLASGLPQLVLRTLLGQIGRNLFLVAAARPGHVLIEHGVAGLVESIGRLERHVAGVVSWDDFLVAFRFLYRLRQGSDGMRHDLVPGEERRPQAALKLLAEASTLQGEAAASIERALAGEAARLAAS